MVLHHFLHPETQLGGWEFALGITETVEAGQRLVGRVRRKLRLFGAGRGEFRRAQAGGAARRQIDQRSNRLCAMDGQAARVAMFFDDIGSRPFL
jgi:hypothetical protein